MVTKELSMKLLIDTKALKVCFAEAGNDVFELLSCLLCLPLSTIASLLSKERMVGSTGNVLDSVRELDAKYVVSSKSKEHYLSPTVAATTLRPLQQLLDAQLNASTSFFRCAGYGNFIPCGYVSTIKGSKCPSCSGPMVKAMPHVKLDGLVAGTATYSVMDDLSITPASSMSTISLLSQCGVEDLSTLQEKTVKIGKEEALEILAASLKSKTVLMVVFLHKEKVCWKKEA